MRNKDFIGLILVACGAIFFSTKAIFVKLTYQYDIDSVTLMSLRMLFSLPFYLAIAWFFSRRKHFARLSKKTMFQVVLLGFMGFYLSNYLDLTGLQYISANLERLILFLYPTFVVLISTVFLQSRIRWMEILALLISYLGVALIFTYDLSILGDEVIVGSLFTLGAAVSFAAFNLGARWVMLSMSSVQFTCYAMLSASVVILGHFMLVNDWQLLFALPAKVYIIILAIALISTVLPSFLMTEGISRLGASRASITSMIGPVSTAILAFFILTEPFTLIHGVGMVLVLIGVGIITVFSQED